MKSRLLFITFCFSFILGGCNKGASRLADELTNTSANTNDDSATLVLESALGTVIGALNDVEHVNSYAKLTKPSFSFITSALATSCSSSRFNPAIGKDCGETEQKKTVQAAFNSCTVGPQDQFTLNGTVTLTFDTAETCNTWIAGTALPTSGSVMRTMSNLTRLNPNNSRVATSTVAHENYLNYQIASGIKTTFGATDRTIEILGVRKIRTRPDGQAGFDHSIMSLPPSPIVVTGTKESGNRTIQSGVIRVDHNTAKYSLTANLSGLSWSNACCYPISGTTTFQATGKISGAMIVDFGTGSCGSVRVTDFTNDQKTVLLASCE